MSSRNWSENTNRKTSAPRTQRPIRPDLEPAAGALEGPPGEWDQDEERHVGQRVLLEQHATFPEDGQRIQEWHRLPPPGGGAPQEERGRALPGPQQHDR